MAFSMRMDYSREYLRKDSFRHLYINGKRNGFSIEALLGYYRGHYLSDIELLELYLDGEKLPDEAVTFTLRGKELPLYRLKYAVTEFWSQVEPARLTAIVPGGIAAGEHELELKLMLRIPYMEIGPDHTFMPLDSGEKVTVTVA